MDLHELTQKAFEHGEILAKHESDIATLYRNQSDIKTLAESTQQLALSIEKIAGKLNEVDERLINIEEEKQKKGFTVWQIVTSAIIGGFITYCISILLK